MASLELDARLDNLLSTAQEETVDIDLFAPIQEREECPICMIPFPFDELEVLFFQCCGVRLCKGCVYKQLMNDIKNGVPNHEQNCAFCRKTIEEKDSIKSVKKLMKKNNPEAYMMMASEYEVGQMVFQSDTKALELRIRAAELGYANAYGNIGKHYDHGIAVKQDKSKALEYYEISAKKGSINAHRNLAVFHETNGNVDESIKHRKVLSSAGDQGSMDSLMQSYKDKLLSKEDLTTTLHAFQTSNNVVKSKDRDDERAYINSKNKKQPA